jgi:hypothetical protein
MWSRHAAFCLLGMMAGCGSGAGTTIAPDGGPTPDVSVADAVPDAGADLNSDLPPLPPASARALLPGKARLTGNGPTSCSHGPRSAALGAWCAFTRTLDAGDGGEIVELWVMNLSRVTAGQPVACDGTSPDCRRVHPNLWTGGALGGPLFPYDDHFDGDTLIFYAGGISTKPDGVYEGPVWAWRPGWAEARVISGEKGLLCFGHESAEVAYCVENVLQGPPIQFDLRAGTLTDAPGALPLVATNVRPWKEGEIAWHAEFSPDGTQFAISAQEPSTEGEVLHVGKTADLGKKALPEIAYNATAWRISLDGQKIYYLKDFVAGDTPGGKLVMADFPAGTNPVTLQERVASFDLLGEPGAVDRGLGFFQDKAMGLAKYRVMADRLHPEQVVTVADGLDEVFTSPDGRYAIFAREDAMGFERLNLASTDGKQTCELNGMQESEAFGLHFLDDSSMVFWSEISDVISDGVPEGWLARTAGCADKQKYADKADFVTTVDDRIALIGHTPKDEVHYVLEQARIGTGPKPLAMATLIGAQTDGLVVTVSDRRSTHVLYQVPEGDMQGIYLYGPLER